MFKQTPGRPARFFTAAVEPNSRVTVGLKVHDVDPDQTKSQLRTQSLSKPRCVPWNSLTVKCSDLVHMRKSA